MAFGRVKKSTLAEEIVANLLSLITERQLRPGDKLPPERDLAAMMHVSRLSLREALRALAMMNIVEIRQGDGTYVTSLKPELLIEHLDFVFSLEDATFLQLFEARRVLEVGIVMMAAERVTDADIAEMESWLAVARQNVDNHEAFAETDIKLHDKIVECARNPMLSRFMASVSQLGRASRRRTTEIPGVPRQVLEDHRAIIEALKARDPDAARLAMLYHLKNIENQLRGVSFFGTDETAAPTAGGDLR